MVCRETFLKLRTVLFQILVIWLIPKVLHVQAYGADRKEVSVTLP